MNRLNLRVATTIRLLIGTVIVAVGVQTNWPFLSSVWAQDQSQAGLVIQHGDGSIITRCIRFAGESTRGYNLLTASGLDLHVEVRGAAGAAICAIDNEGCAFPEAPCFCECMGETCTYWNYWKQDAGEWVHSSLGAVASVVVDGDVDAWSWATVDDISSEPVPPRLLSFADICEPRTLFLPIINK